VIIGLTEESIRMEGFVKDHFRLDSIDMALETLRNFKSFMVDFLVKITEVIR